MAAGRLSVASATPSTDPLPALLEPDGYCVLRRLVPTEIVDDALRRLTLEMVREGVTADQIRNWSQTTFFPHLRWEDEVFAVRRFVEDVVDRQPDEQWADAQLLVRFPDEATSWPLESHVDALPDWAGDRSYRVIAGAALTRARVKDGALVVWPRSHRGESRPPKALEVEPGDVILMHPQLGHSGTLNRGGGIRCAIYFRLLTS